MTWVGQRSSSRWRMSRITAPVGEVTTPITRGRNGSARFLRLVEQPFGGQRPPALVEQRHQRARPGQLHPVDDDLIFRAAGVGRQLARRDDFGAVLGAEGEAARLPLPDHRVDARALVLEGEIAMARGVALPPRNLAAHADMAERAFDRALERARQFADRLRAANCRRGARSLSGRDRHWVQGRERS